MNMKARTFMGGLIGGVIFSALLFNSAGYGAYKEEPARKPVKRYYQSGKLFSEKFYGSGVSEYTVKEYYEGGPLRSETPYKDGKKEGVAKEYFKNGKLRSEISYRGGKRDGPFKAYYENGELKGEMAYKDGEVEGVLRYDQNEPAARDIMNELAKQIDTENEKK